MRSHMVMDCLKAQMDTCQNCDMRIILLHVCVVDRLVHENQPFLHMFHDSCAEAIAVGG